SSSPPIYLNSLPTRRSSDLIFYLPMDSSSNAKRFLDIVQPRLVLWIKYEYWYYYLTEIKNRNIPALLISGIFRKDQLFFKWYGQDRKSTRLNSSHVAISYAV